MRAMLAIAAVLLVGAVATPEAGAPAAAVPTSSSSAAKKKLRNGCERLYPQRRFYTYTKRRYRTRLHVTRGQQRYIKRMARCQHSDRKERWAWSKRARLRARRAYLWVWQRRFERLASGDRSWAYSTGSCESGNDPTEHDDATERTYHGAFQFSMATASSAGFTADPHTRSWAEQAVRSVRWMHVAGKSQWPVCG